MQMSTKEGKKTKKPEDNIRSKKKRRTISSEQQTLKSGRKGCTRKSLWFQNLNSIVK